MIRLLVTTFHAFLDVRLDVAEGKAEVGLIEDTRGIYFGPAAADGRKFVLAQNHGLNGRVKDPKQPSNRLYRLNDDFSLGAAFADDVEMIGCHQLRGIGDFICAIVCVGSKLLVFNTKTLKNVGQIDLFALVPPEHRVTAEQCKPPLGILDPYHFNSITFDERYAYILAHNWDRGSFGMKLTYAMGPDGPTDFECVEAYRDVGVTSHDIVAIDGGLFVLDSNGGRVLRAANGKVEAIVTLPSEPRPFLRGLSVTKDYLIAGYGAFGDHGSRDRGFSRLLVIDRRTLKQVSDVYLGEFANVCDMLVVSEPDYSDSWDGRPK